MNSVETDRARSALPILALIVCIGLALRLAAVFAFAHVPESDELAYRSMALNLVAGREMVDDLGNRAMYNAGYPVFVLAPVYALFGDNLLLARVVNVLLGGTSIALCYAVAREAGAGRLGRLLAAALWAIYLPASVYVVYLLKENLMTPLMLGLVWCALRLVKRDSNTAAIACGVLLGALALTGNAALCLVSIVALAVAWAPASGLRRLTLSLLILGISIALPTPWILRNLQAIGAPVLNTNGGFNLYLGNNPDATGMFVSIADTPRGPTWQALRKQGEYQASEILKHEAISWIQSHPAEFVELAVKKAAYFWQPPLHDGKGQQSSKEKLVRLIWAVEFLVIAASALSTLLVPRLRDRLRALLWLALVSYTAVHMLFYVILRYREPIMPVLTILSALAIEHWLVGRRKAASA